MDPCLVPFYVGISWCSCLAYCSKILFQNSHGACILIEVTVYCSIAEFVLQLCFEDKIKCKVAIRSAHNIPSVVSSWICLMALYELFHFKYLVILTMECAIFLTTSNVLISSSQPTHHLGNPVEHLLMKLFCWHIIKDLFSMQMVFSSRTPELWNTCLWCNRFSFSQIQIGKHTQYLILLLSLCFRSQL